MEPPALGVCRPSPRGAWTCPLGLPPLLGESGGHPRNFTECVVGRISPEPKKLHYALEFLLEEIKSFLDIFEVFATRENNFSR